MLVFAQISTVIQTSTLLLFQNKQKPYCTGSSQNFVEVSHKVLEVLSTIKVRLN